MLDLIDTINKCQLGEIQAFRELFCYMEPKALGTAYLISGNRGLTEDIVQETFVCCMEQIKTLKSPEAFNVWFYRMLVRIGWKMVKNHSRLLPKEEILHSTVQSNTEEQVERSIIHSRLRDAVCELPDNLKTVIILYYFNGMSIEEIAKVTGTLKATVKTRLYYARKVLHQKLEGDVLGNEERVAFSKKLKKV